MYSSVIPIIIAILLLLTNAFFVAAEFALVKIRETRLEELSNQGHRVARLAFGMVKNLDNYLSATQLGITLASLGLGYVGEPAFHWIIAPILTTFFHLTPEQHHQISLTASFLFFSAFHIILGELVPKSLAIQATEKVVMFVTLPMRIFYYTFYPFLWFLQGCSRLVLKSLHLPEAKHMPFASEEELRLIVEDSAESGALTKPKQDLINNVFQFSKVKVRDIMVPVDQMYCFYLDKSVQENMRVAEDSQHTRYPLFDTKGGTVLGFVHIKDIIYNYISPELINLYDLCRPLIMFKENKRIDFALKDFRASKTHLAVVLAQDNKVIGFVALEDVLEQLVGAIADEFDEEDAQL